MLRVGISFLTGVILGYFIFVNIFKSILDPKPEDIVVKNELVLATESSDTPKPTPTNTPEIEPTASPTPKPTIVPIKTPTPTIAPSQPKFTSSEINSFIDRFSAQYNVDPHVIRHIALCESGFNPFAKNGDYLGLFQFGPVTWSNYRKAMGEDTELSLRANAEEAIQTASYALSLGKRHLWPNCVPL